MRLIALVLAMALLASALALPTSATGQAVEVAPHARLVEFWTIPDRPAMGEPFELHLTLRLRPGTAGFPEHVLPSSAYAEGTGPGSFSEVAASGDSIDLVAAFPMIAFRSGVVGLPELPLRFLAATGQGEDGWRWEEGKAGARIGDPATEGTLVLLRLGAIQVASVLPDDTGDPLVLRPAADVFGGERSRRGLVGLALLWLAAGLGAPAVLLVIGSTLRSRRVKIRPGESARNVALAGLDRALADGWHREGRMSDFYRAITRTMRTFAASLDTEWGADLTMREVVAGVMLRWGPDLAGGLASSVARAERVCFGDERPSLHAAEEDWRRIRDWVRDTPGAA